MEVSLAGCVLICLWLMKMLMKIELPAH